MSVLTFDDLHTQAGGLHALLYMLYEASCDLDYASNNAPAVAAANRVNSLIILARDEAERLDSGIGECITSRNREVHAKRAAAVAQPTVDSGLIIDPSKLSVDQMFALFTALGTIGEVMDGLLCQPKFQRKDDLNEAGEMLDRLREMVGDVRDAIRQEVAARPAHKGDLSQLVFFAAEEWTDGSCDPGPALKGLTAALTDLGKAVSK